MVFKGILQKRISPPEFAMVTPSDAKEVDTDHAFDKLLVSIGFLQTSLITG